MAKLQKLESRIAIVSRAFSEFLLVPTFIIILFIFFAWFTNELDQMNIPFLHPVRYFLERHFFSDTSATGDLLGAIVSGTISVTTLTTTLLLVIVQQSASSMTTQVFDQFLRRKTNQFYLGFFVGLSLYAMITLATVNPPFNPVLGGTIAFSLTAFALYLLVLLMYTTINQMRPAQIIQAIYLRILDARKKQLTVFSYTTHFANEEMWQNAIAIDSWQGGYLSNINTKRLHQFMNTKCNGSKILFRSSIGDYVCFDDVLAEVLTTDPAHYQLIKAEMPNCVQLSIQRNLDADAAFGITQIGTIAWTSTSTAQSNPGPGVLCVNSLHNLLNCFNQEKPLEKQVAEDIIYYRDNTLDVLMHGFENIAVASSESLQHQIFVEVLNAASNLLRKANATQRARIEKLLTVLFSVIEKHVLTSILNTALHRLLKVLHQVKMTSAAVALEAILYRIGEPVKEQRLITAEG